MSECKPKAPRCAVSGALAGLVCGLFGGGGGMILVPLLTRWAGLEDRRAFATATCVIAPLCLVSLLFYGSQVQLGQVWGYLAGGFAGGLAGALLLRRVPVAWLHKALGLLILYGALRLLRA